MMLWIIYLKENLMALSNLFRFFVFLTFSLFLSCCVFNALFAEIGVNFDDGQLPPFLCILHFTLYEKYINQFNDISLSLQ